MFKIRTRRSLQQRCSPSIIWGLVYAHVENTGMTASFSEEGMFVAIELV